jgi:60 kDa SS-A/Ro ribonucleoprotein
MNKNISPSPARGPVTDTVNEAGGYAYSYDAKTAASVFAMTATFPDLAGYLSGVDQLDRFVETLNACDTEFRLKLAVYSRQNGKMKDASLVALLHALICGDNPEMGEMVFPQVVDTPQQLLHAARIVRSGVLGRKSFGSCLKRLFTNRLFSFGTDYIVRRGLAGNDPSISDLLAMLHPKPIDDEWAALFSYIRGRPCQEEKLPELLRAYVAFKRDPKSAPVPRGMDIQHILGLIPSDGTAICKEVVRGMSWTQIFKNLAWMSRKGLFHDADFTGYVASRLSDSAEVKKSRIFPYVIMHVYRVLFRSKESLEIPRPIQDAFHFALDASIDAVVSIPEQRVVVCVDVSYSMDSPVAGIRKGATSSASVLDVAAVFAAGVVKKNPLTSLVFFNEDIVNCPPISSRDTALTIVESMPAAECGTDISCAFRHIEDKMKPDSIILLSDNESWVESVDCGVEATAALESFRRIQKKSGCKTKLVCWNLQASGTTQAIGDDILQVAGYSDDIWNVVGDFLNGVKSVSCEVNGPANWLEAIENVQIGGDS